MASYTGTTYENGNWVNTARDLSQGFVDPWQVYHQGTDLGNGQMWFANPTGQKIGTADAYWRLADAAGLPVAGVTSGANDANKTSQSTLDFINNYVKQGVGYNGQTGFTVSRDQLPNFMSSGAAIQDRRDNEKYAVKDGWGLMDTLGVLGLVAGGYGLLNGGFGAAGAGAGEAAAGADALAEIPLSSLAQPVSAAAMGGSYGSIGAGLAGASAIPEAFIDATSLAGGAGAGTAAALAGGGALAANALGSSAASSGPIENVNVDATKIPTTQTGSNGLLTAAGMGLGATALNGIMNGPTAGDPTVANSNGTTGGDASTLSTLFDKLTSSPYALSSLLNLGGSLLGANAASKAGQIQADAANNATNAQLKMFDTINNQQKPYRDAGYAALGSLTGRLTDGDLLHKFNANDLTASLAPNYQFQLDQGLRATKNAANLQTGLLSGNTIKGVNDYTQDYAKGAYQQAFDNYNTNQTNIYNRLANIAGLGQQAGTASTTGAPSFSNGISNTITGAGAAQAAGQVGTANAIAGGLNNVASWYALPQIMATR